MRQQKLMLFSVLFLVGFGIGWFFFRHKETKTKIMAGVIGGAIVPIILYFFHPVGISDAAPPPKSFSDFFATYGFIGHPTNQSGNPRQPIMAGA